MKCLAGLWLGCGSDVLRTVVTSDLRTADAIEWEVRLRHDGRGVDLVRSWDGIEWKLQPENSVR